MLHGGRASLRFLMLLSGFACLGIARAAAQELAVADRGPRFLRQVSTAEPPVELDMNATPVLRRRISLTGETLTLSQILGTIRRQAGLKFIYSADVVPGDRKVGLRADSITVAAALTEILLDAGVDVVFFSAREAGLVRREPPQVGAIAGTVADGKIGAVIVGATVVVERTSFSATTDDKGRYRIADVPTGTYTVRARYIGYAPGTASVTVSADQEATADFALEKSAQKLDEVVTTGTMVPTEVKALPTPITVITADDIQRQGLQDASQIFRGDVPGAVTTNYGGFDNYAVPVYVRGTSSLAALASIKTFIDGVEVALPSALTMIDASTIDRVEVTRGPQASTLYGTGALSGVMQIFTKKGELGLTRPTVTAKISAGGIGGVGGQSTAPQTDNAVSVFGGNQKTSYHVGGSYRRQGEWVPTGGLGGPTDWSLSAGGQTVQGPLALSGVASYGYKAFGYPWLTPFQTFIAQGFSKPYFAPLVQRQQTYGLTASVQATRHWQHTLTLGYDNNTETFDQTQPSFVTPADSFLFAEVIPTATTSLLYHTDLSLRLGPAVAATMTAGANYAAYDGGFTYTANATRTTGSLDGSTIVQRTPSSTTGYFGQVQVAVAERLFLTGGLRGERNPLLGADFGTAWSPRVGAAYALGLGSATVKLRGSYGEGIRAPTLGEAIPFSTPTNHQLPNPNLGPERQRGGDGGVDIYLGRASVGITYYRQTAIDLIASVLVAVEPGAPPTRQYQNLGQVKNDGWEFEAHLPLGPVQVSGTYSITHSTVQALPPGYPAGQYQPGDPILGVPRRSAGATVTYSPLSGTTLTASMTHVGPFTQRDAVAFYGYLYGGQPYRGSQRAYWIEFPSVTKFGVGASQLLGRNLTAFARVENVGNNRRPEQLNIYFATPRSVLVGMDVRY